MVEYSSTTFAIVPVDVQVILLTEPALKFSPPFGDVRVMVADEEPIIVKRLLLMSFLPDALEASETRTRPEAVGVFGTVHAKLPVLGVLETIVEYVTPELIEYSRTTFAIVPVEIHVILSMEPALKFSPPFGDVRVRVGVGAPRMVNRLLLTSFLADAFAASETRIRPEAVGVFGTIQA